MAVAFQVSESSFATFSSSSRIKCSLHRPSPSTVHISSSRLLPSTTSAQFQDLVIQIPTKKSPLVWSTGRNPRVSRRCGEHIVCDTQEAIVDLPTVTGTTWKSTILKAEGPVLVEFFAPWCGPCRIIHPVVAELSTQYAGKIKCFKLNTDESPSIATKYGIRSIPTMMIFVNGEKKDAVIGAVPKTTLIATIEKFC